MEFVVTGYESFFAFKGFPYHIQPFVVVEQIGGVTLEGVEWRHDKPHLIQSRQLPELPGQCDMSVMYGIKRASEKAGAKHSVSVVVVGSGIISRQKERGAVPLSFCR